MSFAQYGPPKNIPPAYRPPEMPPLREDYQPDEGSWSVSAGGIFISPTAKFAGVDLKAREQFGGFVSAEYYLMPELSLELAIKVAHVADPSVTFNDIFVAGDSLTATLDMDAVNVTLSGKAYPLQLLATQTDRFQPFVTIGIGALFLPMTTKGTYTSPGNPTVTVRVDQTEAMGTVHLGGGFDIFITKDFAFTAEGLYLLTFGTPKITVNSFSASLDIKSAVARLGFKYVF
jgi:hypothetical protein